MPMVLERLIARKDRMRKMPLWKFGVQGILLLLAVPILLKDWPREGLTSAVTGQVDPSAGYTLTLNAQPIEQTFTAQAKYLEQIHVYVEAECPVELTATLTSLAEPEAALLQSIVQSSSGGQWLPLDWDCELDEGQEYRIALTSADEGAVVFVSEHAEEQGAYPSAQAGEQLVLTFRYEVPTFDLVQRLLWLVFFVLLSLFLWCSGRGRRIAWFCGAVFFLTLVYQYNILDSTNVLFGVFQGDSQNLVVLGINAEYSQTPERFNRYGLIAGDLTDYVSQVGLQGYLCRFAAKFARYVLPFDMFCTLCQLVCSGLLALVACSIVWMLAHRYDKLLAGCFFAVFCLSPWVVNFARNLYWVEFTWYVPMLIGLLCAAWPNSCWGGWTGIVATFAALFVKCLCGYEYITSIMLGLILFPVTEWVVCIARGDAVAARGWFVRIFRLGCAALAGFFAALCLHAVLRGEGGLLTGLRTIFEEDVLRRTLGGDANLFDPVDLTSFDSSIWQTVMRYFDFNIYYSTQVLLGMDSNLFTPLVLGGAASAVYLYHTSDGVRSVTLYTMGALIPLSWFVLAKAHSYVHVHMNFVLWYIGFVPVCLYLILKAAKYRLGRANYAGTAAKSNPEVNI